MNEDSGHCFPRPHKLMDVASGRQKMNGLITKHGISKDFLFMSYPILTSVSSTICRGPMCIFLTGT